MTVVFTRTVTPNSGHLSDSLKFVKKRIKALKKTYGLKISLNARFGGPAGQLIMVSYHNDMRDLEKVRRKIMKGVMSGKIPQPKPGIVKKVEDAVWIGL
ncbi:MAG: hypothetical protein GY947_16875 [Rhodobacteraceae bacterium]|nr:hypothetical protein [Paracoccaceae bacterium]